MNHPLKETSQTLSQRTLTQRQAKMGVTLKKSQVQLRDQPPAKQAALSHYPDQYQLMEQQQLCQSGCDCDVCRSVPYHIGSVASSSHNSNIAPKQTSTNEIFNYQSFHQPDHQLWTTLNKDDAVAFRKDAHTLPFSHSASDEEHQQHRCGDEVHENSEDDNLPHKISTYVEEVIEDHNNSSDHQHLRGSLAAQQQQPQMLRSSSPPPSNPLKFQASSSYFKGRIRADSDPQQTPQSNQYLEEQRVTQNRFTSEEPLDDGPYSADNIKMSSLSISSEPTSYLELNQKGRGATQATPVQNGGPSQRYQRKHLSEGNASPSPATLIAQENSHRSKHNPLACYKQEVYSQGGYPKAFYMAPAYPTQQQTLDPHHHQHLQPHPAHMYTPPTNLSSVVPPSQQQQHQQQGMYPQGGGGQNQFFQNQQIILNIQQQKAMLSIEQYRLIREQQQIQQSNMPAPQQTPYLDRQQQQQQPQQYQQLDNIQQQQLHGGLIPPPPQQQHNNNNNNSIGEEQTYYAMSNQHVRNTQRPPTVYGGGSGQNTAEKSYELSQNSFQSPISTRNLLYSSQQEGESDVYENFQHKRVANVADNTFDNFMIRGLPGPSPATLMPHHQLSYLEQLEQQENQKKLAQQFYTSSVRGSHSHTQYSNSNGATSYGMAAPQNQLPHRLQQNQAQQQQPKKKNYSQKSKLSTTTASGTGSYEKHQNYQKGEQATSINSDDETSNALYATHLIQKLEQSDKSQSGKIAILTDHISRLACTQTGSRYLQKELQKADSLFVEFILQDIGKSLAGIMIDRYGNYFCQKLLSCCTSQQRSQVLQLIKADFTRISCDQRGTHTVQSILDNIELTLYEEFVKQTLVGKVCQLSMDQQGTHVIQKLIQRPERSLEAFDRIFNFIFQEIQEQINNLCVNRNGLCVVKIVVAGTTKLEQQQHIMDKMSKNAVAIACDPFGNYAITEIITRWPKQVCAPIFEALRSHLSELCIQKYSSNVLENCFERAPDEVRSQYVMELVHCERLPNLIKNGFGNYVIQKSLKVVQGAERDSLVEAIQKCIPVIQDRKIRKKWEKIIATTQHNAEQYNDITSLDTVSVQSTDQMPQKGKQRSDELFLGKQANSHDDYQPSSRQYQVKSQKAAKNVRF